MTSPDRFSEFLALRRAGPAHRQWAAAAIGLGVVVTSALAPFAERALPRSELFLGIYDAAVVIVELTIAALLLGQFVILRTVALLFLIGAYTFGAAMAAFHMLSFPGLFSPLGLLGAGPQTTAWLYFAWRGGQALAIAGYALANRLAPERTSSCSGSCAGATAMGAALALAVAALLISTRGHEALPSIMAGDADLWLKRVVAGVTFVIVAAPLPAIAWRRPLSLLDLWLVVAVCAWLCEVALESVFNSGRFSLGWYAGRMFGVSAAGALLMALVVQDSRVHRRLRAAYASEAEVRRLSEARLAGREDELRRVAHELHEGVAQTLAVLKLELHALAERAAGDGGELTTRLLHADRTVDTALSGVRRVVAELRPPMLDHLGVVPSLEALVDRLMAQKGIDCDLAVEPAEAQLDETCSTAVFRIVEDLLAAARPAAGLGSDASCRVQVGEKEVLLRVVFHRQPGPGAAVVDSVRERALILGGGVAVASDAHDGSATIEVSFPLNHAAAPV